MAPRSFVHLHCHSHYSLLDGANRIPELVEQTKKLGMNAVALTDHGNLYGAIELYREARAAGVNPIVGYEAYVAPGKRTEKAAKRSDAAFHLTLLAKNATGFKNLVKLSSLAFLEGYHYVPRIDKELLAAHAEGLICLSGCLSGEFNEHLLKDDAARAEELAAWYAKLFGDDFYVELQNNGLDIQDACTEEAVRIADKMGLPLVATADAHYLCQQDAAAHDVLICINTGAKRSDAKRMRYGDNSRLVNPYYVRSPEDMYKLFPGRLGEAVARSQQIADGCDLQLDFKKRHFPVFAQPAGLTPEEYLRQLCDIGFRERYGENPRKGARERLEHELGVICRMGFAGYFLIVWDFVRFSRDAGIPASARGSGCGAVVSYVLYLSHVDPLEYDLLFERFLDPNRAEAPDIDIDFCQDQREKVIAYVKDKYGAESVAQIATFGTLAAKAALKDVGRVLDISLDRVNQMTKLVPMRGAISASLDEALAESPEFRREYEVDPQTREWVDIARKLEGTNRNAGTHAAGVVIANGPITDYVPVHRVVRKGDDAGSRAGEAVITTQWTMGDLEKVGMLKMDFLGLRTLTVLDKTVRLIEKTRGEKIDVYALPLDDAETYKLLQKGDAKGVFQFESDGIRELLKRLKPDNIRDIIACTALYRPGPLQGGLVDEYIECKHGRKKPTYAHPVMEEVLSETYGVMVYQEAIMRILNKLGGIELSSAYACIKAISKKKHDIIDQRKAEFIKGAVERGVSEEKATEIFDLIVFFGGYGFNKCVVADTLVTDARTGERVTVGELFRTRRAIDVHALGDDGRLRPRPVTDVVWNGRKPVFRLTTQLGHVITATANHPFRTLDGWTNLGDLKPGDRVAAPRRLTVAGTVAWPRHEIVVLAHLLSEGNTCHPSSLYFFNNDPRLIDEFSESVAQFPDTVARAYARPNGRMEVCANTGNRPAAEGAVATARRRRCGAFEWAGRLGILGKKAAEKFVPPAVFSFDDADLELFLGRMWAGDGFVGTEIQMPFYATSSERLAYDVQALLLRLGIVSRIHRKTFAYRGGTRAGFTTHLVGEEAVRGFLRRVGPHVLGKEDRVEQMRSLFAGRPAGRSCKDTIPASVRRWVDDARRAAGLTWRALEEGSGVSMKEFQYKGAAGKQGFRRETITRLGEFLKSERLTNLAAADVYWDRVVAIEPAGEEDTYDLTVDTDHNFVADGLVVHNSHSAAYAVVSYQTAYLKRHYTPEFMAALLSSEIDDGNKRDILVDHIRDAKQLGVNVRPPNVNEGESDFTVQKGDIVFGLTAIKGVGRGAAEAISQTRAAGGPFRDLFDFCERIDPKVVPKAAVEKLVKAGAFDKFGNRQQHWLALPQAVLAASARHEDRRRGQGDLFDDAPADGGPAAADAVPLPAVEEWPPAERLKYEKEVLDFYLSSHPLAQVADDVRRFTHHTVEQLLKLDSGTEVLMGGMLAQVQFRTTKKPGRNGNNRYVICRLEDFTGAVKCFMWPDDLVQYAAFFADDRVVFVKGMLERNDDSVQVKLTRVFDLETARREMTKNLILRLKFGRHGPGDVDAVGRVLRRSPGPCPVYLDVTDAAGRHAKFRVGAELRVNPANLPLDELELILGPGSVVFAGR